MPDTTEMPAFAFADGALSIHTPRAEMRIQWRPKPLAEELIPGARRWTSFWPDFRLLRPLTPATRRHAFTLDLNVDDLEQELAAQKTAAFSAFRQELPPEIVSVVERFGSHQWAMLLLLTEQPRSMDLALSNPVLVYCLANNDQFRSARIDTASFQAISYSHRKQRIVLEWLDFPGTEAMVRLTRKIPAECANPSILRRLRNAGNADKRAFDMLAHLPKINAAALELVTYPQLLDLITPKLLLEVAETDTDPIEPSACDILLSSVGIVRTVAPRRPVMPFSSMQQLRRFQQEADAEYQAHLARQEEAARREAAERQRRKDAARRRAQEREPQQLMPFAGDQVLYEQGRRGAINVARRQKPKNAALVHRRFPSPPVPGTPDIIPLTSERAIWLEGQEQNNCVFNYVYRVCTDEKYIYRVMAPERATLAIDRGRDGSWRCAELKARGNAKVRDATVHAVDAWLASHRVSV